MHKVDGFELEFTARTSWTARVYKGGKEVADVPVAWADQMIWDRTAKAPGEFIVWFTTTLKAADWAQRSEAIIAIAHAVDPTEQPRRFKQFSRLYKVQPLDVTENPLAVRARYVSLVTTESMEAQLTS